MLFATIKLLFQVPNTSKLPKRLLKSEKRNRKSHGLSFLIRHTSPMGVFDHLQKGGVFSIQPQKPQIRKVVQARPAPPSRSASSHVPNHASSRNPSRPVNGGKKISPKSRSASTETESRLSRNRLRTPSGNRKRPTPEMRLSSDDDDDDEGDNSDASFDVRKRARIGDATEIDPKRRIRSLAAFSEGHKESLPLIQAADVTSSRESGKYRHAFGETEKSARIFLQYPSASQKERLADDSRLPL